MDSSYKRHYVKLRSRFHTYSNIEEQDPLIFENSSDIEMELSVPKLKLINEEIKNDFCDIRANHQSFESQRTSPGVCSVPIC